MYLITKQQGAYQAIPIKTGDRWDFHKLAIGKQEVRIILRVRGRQYLLYSTSALAAKHRDLRQEHLIPLCDEIIAKTSERIYRGDAYIDFGEIAAAAECRHQRHWRAQGLITPATPTTYPGHPIDPKTEQLVSHVRIDLEDIIVIDHAPPIDCDQEELPY